MGKGRTKRYCVLLILISFLMGVCFDCAQSEDFPGNMPEHRDIQVISQDMGELLLYDDICTVETAGIYREVMNGGRASHLQNLRQYHGNCTVCLTQDGSSVTEKADTAF